MGKVWSGFWILLIVGFILFVIGAIFYEIKKKEKVPIWAYFLLVLGAGLVIVAAGIYLYQSYPFYSSGCCGKTKGVESLLPPGRDYTIREDELVTLSPVTQYYDQRSKVLSISSTPSSSIPAPPSVQSPLPVTFSAPTYTTTGYQAPNVSATRQVIFAGPAAGVPPGVIRTGGSLGDLAPS